MLGEFEICEAAPSLFEHIYFEKNVWVFGNLPGEFEICQENLKCTRRI
jgi:hypothetical protein